ALRRVLAVEARPPLGPPRVDRLEGGPEDAILEIQMRAELLEERSRRRTELSARTGHERPQLGHPPAQSLVLLDDQHAHAARDELALLGHGTPLLTTMYPRGRRRPAPWCGRTREAR